MMREATMRAALLVLSLLAAAPALAQAPSDFYTPRSGNSEFYLSPLITPGQDVSFRGGGNAHTDAGIGLGFGFAHYFSPNFSGGIELDWTNTGYRATVQPGTGNPNGPTNMWSTLETFTLRFNGTYNFTTGQWKPLITGGFGWTYLDSNIPSGLAQNVCWIYPWYGEVCGVYQPTIATTKFSYNAGIGLRYDYSRNAFMRGILSEQAVSFGGSYGTKAVPQLRLDFGWRF